MPIALPEAAAAVERYRASGVPVSTRSGARAVEIRPLRVLVVNLMPSPLETETRVLRLLADSPLQIEVALLRRLDGNGVAGGTEGGLIELQRSFDVVRDGRFDGVVVVAGRAELTADHAPGPTIDQFTAFLDWTRSRVRASFFIGWAAEAALGHFHGVLGQWQAEPTVAVVPHRVVGGAAAGVPALVASQDRIVPVPVARASRYPGAAVRAKGLEVLVEHPEAGAHLIHEPEARRLYALDHIEASAGMFARALRRRHGAEAADTADGIRPGQPWRSYAHLLFADWLGREVQGAVAEGE